QCSDNCLKCSIPTQCQVCQFGYFELTINQNDIICIKCPYFDITLGQNQSIFQCANCIFDHFKFSQTLKCEYNYVLNSKIPTSNPQLYQNYLKIQDQTAQQLFILIKIDFKTFKLEQCFGCEQWCLNQINPKCFIFDEANFYPLQKYVLCKNGFFYVNKTCQQCPSNCIECDLQKNCLQCDKGYVINNLFQCQLCTTLLSDCLECFFGNSSLNLNEQPQLWKQYLTPQDLIDNNITIRCTKCNISTTYLIPSKDLLKCEGCNPNCISCYYIKQDNGVQINHSINPKVIPNDEISLYQKYCFLCIVSYFVSFNGTCEICDISRCNLCYYGELSGTNQFYTLNIGFIYLTNKGKLVKKCYDCVSSSTSQRAIMINGSCSTQNSLKTLDANCYQWLQINTTSVLANDYICMECNNYGFNIDLPANQRKCDKSNSVIHPNCVSFYYYLSGLNSLIISICVRCKRGFTASVANGCVSCQSGQDFDYGITAENICKHCSHITPTGYNFTHYIFFNRPKIPQNQIDLIEQTYNIRTKPLCEVCIDKKVYGVCTNLNFCQLLVSNCQKLTSVYDGCKTDQNSVVYCESCPFKLQDVKNSDSTISKVKISQTVALIPNQCSLCPRYCSFCQERTLDQIKQQNPYFITQLIFKQFTTKCFKCIQVNDMCNLGDSKGGFGYTCPFTNNASGTDFAPYYNQIVNQCTICNKQNLQCNRIHKMQKIIDCRSLNDIASGMKIDTLTLTKINIQEQSFSNTIDLNFNEFDTYELQKDLFYRLNEDNFTQFQFEILVIPIKKSFKLQNGQTVTDGAYCMFPSQLNISTKIARYSRIFQMCESTLLTDIVPIFSLTNINIQEIVFDNVFHPIYLIMLIKQFQKM
ncbi:hypothetical protein IMG5_067860, partial [Ichthyophthirius multifiliis]